jgi:hypothetical protein
METKTKTTKTRTSQTNYQFTKSGHEINDLASETLPDQSYTIREILEKFSVNNIPQILLKSQYADNQDENDFEDMDITMQRGTDITDVEERLQNLNSKKAQKTQQKTQKTKEPSDITGLENNEPIKIADEGGAK